MDLSVFDPGKLAVSEGWLSLTPEVIALIGVILSSAVAFIVAALKSKSERMSHDMQIKVQIEKFERDIFQARSQRKIDIAYKYAELNQNDSVAAMLFLNEVAKELAIGFLYQDDGLQKAKIWIRNDANLLIGRNSECDVILKDQFISRQHCVIHTQDNKAYLIPLNPTNPIFINNKKIEGKSMLKNQSRINMSENAFIYFEL